jgi:hypothetical protein
MSKRKNPLVIERQDDGRPIRAVLDPRQPKMSPDPRKTPTRLGQRLLPQVPASSIRTRHTARPRSQN